MDKINRAIIKGAFPVVIMLGAVSASICVFSDNAVKATDANLTMAATIEPSMTLTIDETTPSLDIIPSGGGTFGSANITISAFSNGFVGYNLTMAPSTTDLVGSGTNVIPTLAATSNCRGGTDCSSSDFAPGHWGIAIDNDYYIPATTRTIVETDPSSSVVTQDEYTIYLGANLDLSTAIDEYNTTLTFTATPVIKAYNITFNFDTGITKVDIKDSTGVSTIETISNSGETVALDFANSYFLDPTYAEGYGGSGIAIEGTSSVTDNGILTIGSGGSTVTLSSSNQTFDNAFSDAGKSKKNGYYKMQDMTGDICSNIVTGQEGQLIDDRDDSVYYVAKLRDGNCWMTQNLDFNIDSSKTYTPADTDIPANWTPSTSTYATGTTSWNYLNSSPESYDPGNLCWDGELNTSWDGNLGNATTTCIDGSNKRYHIGNYYNWTAAVAMNDSSSYTTQNQDVNQSICPAGWMLPKSGTVQTGSGSFQYLKDQLGLTAGMSGNIQEYPVFFTYGGNWVGTSSLVGSEGNYWSSVVSNDGYVGYSYELNFNVDGRLYSNGMSFRSEGYPVRCVAHK